MSNCPICGAKAPRPIMINFRYRAVCCEHREMEIDRLGAGFPESILDDSRTAGMALDKWVAINKLLDEAMQQDASSMSGEVDAFDLRLIGAHLESAYQ